jgi:hypothetical protein
VVARGVDNAVWAVELNGATASAWVTARGALGSAPVAVAQPTSGRVDVVANGTDGRLWTASRSGSGWSAWTRAE